MVGGAVVRRLQADGVATIVAPRAELDLRDQDATHRWFAERRPEVVVLAAARVGGILANATYPVDFLYDNLMIEANVMHAAYAAGVDKLLFLGSSCIYPRMAEQPIREESLLTGPLEPTNEWYSIAKIAGIKLAQAYRRQYGCNFISAMPTNLYGPGDNYDLQNSHVFPALLRKVVEAKRGGQSVIHIWGSGEPRREFLHVDDCADACLFLLRHYDADDPINIGVGKDIRIIELARMICEEAHLDAEIACDTSKPDGTPRKLLSVDRINGLGWTPRIGLRAGIAALLDSLEKDGFGLRTPASPAEAALS